MVEKERNEIPLSVAAKVLFRSHRTCCVCREPRKPVQIHHIDEDPSNAQEGNLAVLCFECHHETQVRGGFARRLDSHQIVLYRDDWYGIVDRNRHSVESPSEQRLLDQRLAPVVLEVGIDGKLLHLSYLKLTEKDEQNRYAFDADYPLLAPGNLKIAIETNVTLGAFVTRELQRFRADAIETSAYKAEMEKQFPSSKMCWDNLLMTHEVGAFTNELLTIDFQRWSYGAGAAHANTTTHTLNCLFNPPVQLGFWDVFRHKSNCLETISKYCVASLHGQQPTTLKASYPGETNSWILRGASPEVRNFEKFLLEKGGVRFYFDPYSVACYAEGRYEVFIPISVLAKVTKEPFARLLQEH